MDGGGSLGSGYHREISDDEAKEKLIKRQKIVLDKMKELGMISEDEYNEAQNYELAFKKKDVNYGGTQTYFVDAVVEAVIDDLMEQRNVSRGIAMKMIYTDGYKIYTTQDPTVQSAIDDAFNNESIFYVDWDGNRIQGSIVSRMYFRCTISILVRLVSSHLPNGVCYKHCAVC